MLFLPIYIMNKLLKHILHALANAQDPTDNISRLPPLIIEEAYQMLVSACSQNLLRKPISYIGRESDVLTNASTRICLENYTL